MDPRRVALVTGSGKRRVGWHVAKALAQRGYNLAVHYHSSAVEAAETVASLRGYGVTVIAVPADLREEQGVQALIRKVLSQLGRLDVLVNCAAVWKRKRLEDVTAADVRLHFDT